MSKHLTYNDVDKTETNEWIQAITSVIYNDGIERAQFLINHILQEINNYKLHTNTITKNNNQQHTSNYINTIPAENEPLYPGNLELEHKICSAIRWNAMMMVLKASKKNLELGGHIASFQSAAIIYEVCFNHFFRARNNNDGGDLIYFQGHISPGVYARAFLEGRLTEKQLNNFRQEINNHGLPSYPHPKLMPGFWQFPTVSMGLSAISAIYQAKFLKYLNDRNLKDTSKQTVYAFLGDGEMDEPESTGVLNIASRAQLDNLIFIINCNLQRLDGPVHGNGKIINELENIFNGSGWNVIKVIWGGKWDTLLKQDTTGKLIQLMNETIDGDYQTLRTKNGAYIRKHFFGKYPETQLLVKNMSDDEIWNLNHGGHDPKKIFSALHKAKHTTGKPTVILLHTIKGYGMGTTAESANISHQIKMMTIEDIKNFRNKLHLNHITDDQIKSLPYLIFEKHSEEYTYLHKKRKDLHGYVPSRLKKFTKSFTIPELTDFKSLLNQQKQTSTTIAFVRILNILLQNQSIKHYLVPIIADEARTFGMEGLFRKLGIYNSQGQKYTPQDKDLLAYYKEDKKGQILQEGINELGAGSSWIAAATSYSTNDFPMIPFYIYYSMFGFQRIGDLFWAAADQQARGFLIGGTSGRTTLNGEGLQHADGHSHIHASTIPNCISYDPAYAYELAVIIQNGLARMYGSQQENIFFYLTTLNEKYEMPAMPPGTEEGICKGIYKLESFPGTSGKIQLIGSGAILYHVRKAAQTLSAEYNISSNVYSVTSFTELARDGQDCERWNMLHPMEIPRIPYVTNILDTTPVIASTDYIKLFPEQIRNFIPGKNFLVLGTDGFGRSDSRENLRSHFEINQSHIILAALYQLSKQGIIKDNLVMNTIKKFNIDINKINPRLI
ncbi:pyruvate dehydrogenase (acetyl-transferring), homodimeric type [Blochmannia endosymbiont of Polyrhachis (Hedomyrma) turneri]|uniref:pyruvate dehydrogenase (acetyl-transferring), homodimeric type n=1 Tax=Blochmannia endosymbiont of Polyrhachis (Hedomyrma) turneri TaxID=1505596 RepID=UPI00061A70AB|nr:pyruvate dehydrogenase (acetyl-transferring), homodimeric type [Blochmannia endosymbiont of Polyrhachis (Hedomyrma) turneri]AKC59737.1 Pyruvate dehydrogenase E1 component [Blochmannia endosymbiont of Polyrhachis (Hedomyrma) turneri]